MGRLEGDSELTVRYAGYDQQLALPGLDVVDYAELDDEIILDGSEAFTGIRLGSGATALQAEIFYDPDYSYDRENDTYYLEFYPLDGSNDILPFEVGGVTSHELEKGEVLKGVIKQALYQRALQRSRAIS